MRVGDIVTVKETFINELADNMSDTYIMKGTTLVVLSMQKAADGAKRVQFLAADGKFAQYMGCLIHCFIAGID